MPIVGEKTTQEASADKLHGLGKNNTAHKEAARKAASLSCPERLVEKEQKITLKGNCQYERRYSDLLVPSGFTVIG